ncbi:hypothetical protein [Luteococcus sp.]|uniref:hypothetical protein n=1 Tax=Luteococcus sp. TaxID=1969402 RepID=UPI003736A126
MARQVMVDLDELDHLIRTATHGRIGLTAALAQLITATSATPVHAAAGEDPLEFVARVLLQRLDPDTPHRPVVMSAETDYATGQVEQDLTGALLLACQALPLDTDPGRRADLRTRRQRGHYLLRYADANHPTGQGSAPRGRSE